AVVSARIVSTPQIRFIQDCSVYAQCVKDADELVRFVKRTVSIHLNGGEDKLVNCEMWQNMCCQYPGVYARRSAQYSRY
ncbi:MAG: hypothetical protein WBO09_19450, partial [Methylocystis silviterrae]|uniref:hypothetical protein n=1 Tax=Methylocystis silviterrae TaxID=2743612 RepID=UPI003C762178